MQRPNPCQVEEAKAGLKTALEGDIKPELKPEVVKLQRRADACDVRAGVQGVLYRGCRECRVLRVVVRAF